MHNDNKTDKTGEGLKILVIEDDTLTRLTLCNLLKKLNYRPIEACNGYMGLMMFRRERPDIVITDIIMPDKEGLETIAEIRTASPETKIVAMSSGGERQNMNFLDLARSFGAQETIRKPFKPNDILGILNRLQETTVA